MPPGLGLPASSKAIAAAHIAAPRPEVPIAAMMRRKLAPALADRSRPQIALHQPRPFTPQPNYAGRNDTVCRILARATASITVR